VDREPLYELLTRPHLEDPVLVVCLDGWIDAGFAAATAAAHLVTLLDPTVVARFDVDVLVDHRSRRPITHLVEGVNTGLTWPRLELRHGKDPDGRDVLLLLGSEPDVRWRAFCQQVVALVADLGVHLVVGLGAFPAPVPHTRTAPLVATSTTSELATSVGVIAGRIQAPAGVLAAIERRFATLEIPVIALWARVPHYAATMPYPEASVQLLEGLAKVASVHVDASAMREAVDEVRRRLDELTANSTQHTTLVRQLESQFDAQASVDDVAAASGWADLPTGDELAAELEKYLRDEGL
jgi:proteasome assembly chaperone (PAC2) family protein